MQVTPFPVVHLVVLILNGICVENIDESPYGSSDRVSHEGWIAGLSVDN